MHALRAHCGSYLSDSIRHQWLTEEERQAMDRQHVAQPLPPDDADGDDRRSGREVEDDGEEVEEEEGEGSETEETGAKVQWPLFGSPTLSTIRVTSYTVRGSTLCFTVQPTLEGFHWTVERTFEEFAHLHKTLVNHHGLSKALLPTRKLFSFFSSPQPQYLSDLQLKLDKLLKTVLKTFPVPPRLVLEFCGYPFCDVLSITQSLAVYVYEQGDYVLSNNKALFMSPLQLHSVGHRMTLPIASTGTGSVKGEFGNLLDFLMQLRKLKVAPSTEDPFTLSPREDVSFDLSFFKSLTFLMVDSIDIVNLQGRQALSGQLEGLDIRRGLTSLKEILVVYPVDYVTVNTTGNIDMARALKWTSLTRICFKLNNITSIDQSLQLLPSLESLDLTYNFIERIENLSELPNLKVVDLSYNKVADIRDLHLAIGNISKLGLAHNLLSSLEGFSKCTSLMYLDLSSNQIAEVSMVGYLSGFPVLEELHLQNNPITQASSYRSTVFSYLSSIAEKVVLDGKRVTSDELGLSTSLAGIKGRRKVTSRTADIKPDRYSPTTHQEAQEELEVTTGVASRLEEMRKTGGDKWLSLLNSDKSRTPGSPRLDGDDVVVRGKERKKRHRKHQHNDTAYQPDADSSEGDRHVTMATPVVSSNQHPAMTEEVEEEEEEETEEPSQELRNLIQQLDSERLHLSDFPVTVLEYSGSLDSLSGQDVDQKLVNSRLEECSVFVDSSVRRLVETVLSTSRTRCQRDLALLEHIRLHEGKKRGVCLRFAQFGGGSFWIIYCVRDIASLARLYVAIQQALKTKEISKPAPPEILTPPEPIEAVKIVCNTETELAVPQLQTNLPSETPRDEPVNSPPTAELEESGAWKVEFAISTGTNVPPSTLISPPPSSSSELISPTSSVQTRSRSRSPSPAKPNPPLNDTTSSKTAIATTSSSLGGETTTSRFSGMEKEAASASASISASVNLGPSQHKTQPDPPSPYPVEDIKNPLTNSPPVTRPSRSGAILKVSENDPLANEVTPPSRVSDSSNLHENSKHNSVPLSLTLDSMTKQSKKLAKLSSSARRIVKKPGIEKESLVSFFNGKIAREQKEVLMNIMWGGASLTSAPGLEVEIGLFMSDKGLYLLQVIDTQGEDNFSWTTQNPPLVCSFHMYLLTLSQVKMGIFDQNITLECIEKGALKSLVVYSRTSENTLALLDNLKAGLDSLRVSHSVTTVRESVMRSGEDEGSKVLFVNPDVSDMQKLKESLVQPAVTAQLCSQKMAGYYSTTTGAPSFAEEMKRSCKDLAAKFEVLQYVAVNELSSDLLPVSNSDIHFRPHILVLTNDTLYLCKDDTALWPASTDSPITPPFPRCSVLDSCPMQSVTDIEMCERAQSIVPLSEPVYEFRISFSVTETQGLGGYGGFRRWQLCVYDRQYIDQLFSCLQLLWQDAHSSSLPISHTTDPLTTVPLTPTTPVDKKRSRSFSEKPDFSTYNPTFYSSQPLVRLASLSSSKRVKFFKESVSEGQFLNADEVPVAVFLAFCSTAQSGKDPVQIEVCVMASQYAIYLLTDVDNVRRWLDGGGAASFSRMSLLNKQNADKARCFFHLWIKEIQEIQMGFFYLSLHLRMTNSANDCCIHTQDSASVLALLSAISMGANLRNTQEEEMMDELLSEYIDLASDSLSSSRSRQVKGAKSNIEFREVSPKSLDTLKQILLCISPSITKSTTIDQSTSSLQILLGQVMIVIEEINIRGVHTINHHPQLVLLSNYGLFLCAHSAGDKHSPAVTDASDLRVKQLCHIDLVENVELLPNHPQSIRYPSHVFCIHLSQRGADGHSLVLAAQNKQQLRQFIFQLSLLWWERNDKNMPVFTRV